MKSESQASFARRHGVSQQAVSKAIRYGRFSRATVALVGRRWVIIDSRRADAEWDANARPSMRPSWPLRLATAGRGGRGAA